MNVVLEASIVRRRQRIVRVLIVIGLLLLAGVLRLQQLAQLPPGVFVDEGANGLDALKVLQGHHALFFPENLGREGLIMYADALAIALLGRTVLAVRLPAALASVGTVLAVFWLGQVLFAERRGKGAIPTWRGLFVGATAAGARRTQCLCMSLTPLDRWRGRWDQAPAAGEAPTSGWEPGRPGRGRIPHPGSAGAGAGPYRVYVGMYDPATGTRLDVS